MGVTKSHVTTHRLLTLLLWGTSAIASAQTGVSDDRVSLPDGPGSIEGIGDNASVSSNMGFLTYHVAVEVPAGYATMTPSVGLHYSSGFGSSVVGLGWDLPILTIERMTNRGLPEYQEDDEFVADNGQLVRVSREESVYRHRYEKTFDRFTWRDSNGGREGYWVVEHPDGRTSFFGATADGVLVPSARVGGDRGTFRYHLVETLDRFGHAIRYEYEKRGNVSLLSKIGWVFVDGSPRYRLRFDYEPREDLLSDCKAGFELVLQDRLARITVLNRGTPIRFLELEYENYADSGGVTRLAAAQMHGLDGSPYPVRETFAYSRSLAGQCTSGSCDKPYTVSLGSLGVSLQSGTATLIDINGDALPDVVDTSTAGAAHRLFLNTLDSTGAHAFSAPITSAVGTQSSHDLASPYVQVMDVDGNGLADLVNTQTGEILENQGGGDWNQRLSLWSGENNAIPDLGADFDLSDGELGTIRFLDFDNDRRIDLIRSQGAGASNTTSVFQNLGDAGFVEASGIDPIGAGFDDDRLELEDINGDGLLDPVQVTADAVRYRLNLGLGRWASWMTIAGFDFTDQQQIDAELEDINGDGLADLVLVAGNEVHTWLNRNGAAFEVARVIRESDVDGELPERTESTTVLFADMNGNGSTDIVWIDPSGAVTFLELFPVRPNLLSRIENGLGRVTEVTYGTSVEHLARAGGSVAKVHPLAHPTLVVNQIEAWDELTGNREITTFTYLDGYYDGEEKEFRGFGRVEQHEPGDAATEDSRALEIYDVGDTDSYRKGLLLSRELRGEQRRPLRFETYTYDDCQVAGVDPGVAAPVRYLCLTRETTTIAEGLADEEQWVTLEQQYQYDGYGNRTRSADLGVVAVGGTGCPACSVSGWLGEPCGDECMGDERFETTDHITPEDNDGRWLLNLAWRTRTFTRADAAGTPADDWYTETLTYFDGPAFEGLPLRSATAGAPSRITERRDRSDAVVETHRHRFDEHGNIIETLDPLAQIDGLTHRRLYTMGEAGLRPTRVEILLADQDGPYRLRQDVQYDRHWDKPIEATTWMLVQEDACLSSRNSSFFTYDAFGRLAGVIQPGEAPGQVTQEIEYQLGKPASRIIVRSRSQRSRPLDLEEIRCLDGHGRVFQIRTRIKKGAYRVDGWTVFNSRSDPQQIYQPYNSSSPACDLTPPSAVPSTTVDLDALGRVVRTALPAVDDHGPVETRTEYLPLAEVTYDFEDTYTGSRHADTPTLKRFDGLGRIIAIERRLADQAPWVTTFGYGPTGELSGWIDADGNSRTQQRDLLGRVLRIDDPDRGVTSYAYDNADNITQIKNAKGEQTLFSYDGLNRLIAQWDAADETSRIENTYDLSDACPAERCANGAGRLLRTTYPGGEDRFGYSVRGRPTYTGRIIAGRELALWSEYDNAGRVIANTFPGGGRFDFKLDGAGRVMGVPGIVDHVDFDSRGPLARLALANGAVTTRTYDPMLRLASLATESVDGATVLDLNYERDRMGNVVAINDGLAAMGRSSNAAFTYDALYRLTAASLEPGTPHAERLTFTYDAIGNIRSKVSDTASNAHVGEYHYGRSRPHAVSRAGELGLTYDAAGQLVRRGDMDLTWDHLGRLVRAERGGEILVETMYGPDDQRVAKTDGSESVVFLGSSFEVRNGVAVAYLSIDGERVAKNERFGFAHLLLPDLAPVEGSDHALSVVPDAAITAGDAWIAHATESGLMSLETSEARSDPRAMLRASAISMLHGRSERTTYLHSDHAGNIVAVTDEAGSVIERTHFSPFGSQRFQDTEHSREPRGFVGRETDAGTGLVYLGARYLDPQTGRFISPDPYFAVVNESRIGDVDELTNPYIYARNNPVNFVDERGHLAQAVVGAILGGAVSMVAEAINLRAAGEKLSWATVGKVAYAGARGALLGGLSGGGTAIATAVSLAMTGAGCMVRSTVQGSPEGKALVSGSYDTVASAIGLTTAAVSGDIAGAVGAALDLVGGASEAMTTKSLKDHVFTRLGSIKSSIKSGSTRLKSRIKARWKKATSKRPPSSQARREMRGVAKAMRMRAKIPGAGKVNPLFLAKHGRGKAKAKAKK